jgi:cytochrome c-type biogenesis protein
MEFSLLIPAFIAGFLTFLAPCTLPLVPGYLGFISGVSSEDLHDMKSAKKARLKIFANGLFFMLGFSAVFILMGTLVGFVGAILLAPYRLWLGRIGGVFVIFFGLFMLGVFRIPFLFAEKRFSAPAFFERGKPATSFALGSAFAFGWTPCVGPILGSVLLLASTSTTALQGALLLAVFSLGLAVPFLLVAVLWGSSLGIIGKFSGFLNIVSVIGGIFLIALGVLLLTDNIPLLISWGYRLFQFIEYDRLLEYL